LEARLCFIPSDIGKKPIEAIAGADEQRAEFNTEFAERTKDAEKRGRKSRFLTPKNGGSE
jgi:hypothetical protein